jgi:hypothetical protein
MIYTNLSNLFTDLIKYNEENIELFGNMQIPLTNIYYFTILDNNDETTNQYITFLTDINASTNIDITNNMNFEHEQLHQINIMKSSLKQIDNEIHNVLEVAAESSAKIVLVLDIGFIFKFLKHIKDIDREIHLYDFILYKFKNKIDKLFLLDYDSILTINEKYSIIYDELNMYLSKIKPPIKNIINDFDVTIYNNSNSLYWYFLNSDEKINYLSNDHNNINNDNVSLVNINEEETLLLTTKFSKICFSNLFEKHSNVLNPFDKLKTPSIF